MCARSSLYFPLTSELCMSACATVCQSVSLCVWAHGARFSLLPQRTRTPLPLPHAFPSFLRRICCPLPSPCIISGGDGWRKGVSSSVETLVRRYALAYRERAQRSMHTCSCAVVDPANADDSVHRVYVYTCKDLDPHSRGRAPRQILPRLHHLITDAGLPRLPNGVLE